MRDTVRPAARNQTRRVGGNKGINPHHLGTVLRKGAVLRPLEEVNQIMLFHLAKAHSILVDDRPSVFM